MRYRDYLLLDGSCSSILGIALIVVGWPGLVTDHSYAWTAVPGVLVVLLLLAAFALRRGIPLSEPGRWLTDRSIGAATHDGTALEARAVRRRLVAETTLWIVLVVAWVVATGNSAALVYATGWASLAYGLFQLLLSAPAVSRREWEAGASYLVRKRPGLGTPELIAAQRSRNQLSIVGKATGVGLEGGLRIP